MKKAIYLPSGLVAIVTFVHHNDHLKELAKDYRQLKMKHGSGSNEVNEWVEWNKDKLFTEHLIPDEIEFRANQQMISFLVTPNDFTVLNDFYKEIEFSKTQTTTVAEYLFE